MTNRLFLRRLRRELPRWQEQGWVTNESRQAILDDASRQEGSRVTGPVVSILGLALLAAGIGGIFAAHWQTIPTGVKLAILLGGLAGAGALSAYLYRRSAAQWKLYASQYLVAIIFGLDALLLARMYQVDVNYAQWALIWALGVLAGAIAIKSQPLVIAALLVSVVWTGFESLVYRDSLHWAYLLFWGLCVGIALLQHWRGALHVAMLAFMTWSGLSLRPITLVWSGAHLIHLLQFYFLLYFSLFLAGMVMGTYERIARYGNAIRRYGVFAALLTFFLLTFPDLHRGTRWGLADLSRQPAAASMVTVTLIAAAVVVALVVWYRARTGRFAGAPYIVWGQGLFIAPILLLLVNLFIPGEHANVMAAGFNLVFFGGAAWVIYAGFRQGDRFFVNVAFTFLLLGLGARYLDTFWSLFGRAYFLMLGGVLLVAFGFVLENQRRKLTERILARQDDASE